MTSLPPPRHVDVGVVPAGALEPVVAGAAVEPVLAVPAPQHIVAAEAGDGVAHVAAVDHIGPGGGRGREETDEQILRGKDAVVGEDDLVDAPIVVEELVDERH